ncbi:hypothetical protein ACF0H5_011781 [Mactra antiquata]
MYTLVLFALVSAVTAIKDPTELCNEIDSLDCVRTYIQGERDETVCGTDGVTYNNFCYYSKARCNDKNLSIGSVGACGVATTAAPVVTTASATMMSTGTGAPVTGGVTNAASTTQAPVVTQPMSTMAGTTTPDAILAAFCQNKNSIQCGTDLAPICGSDKQFYLNKCEYSKAYCDDNSLTSKDISFCTGRRSFF